jgi:hypothetical protein
MRPAEPSYEGKLLSTWIAPLFDPDTEDIFQTKSEREAVRDAILHMGTNAILQLGEWATYESTVYHRGFRTLPVPLRDIQLTALNKREKRYEKRAGAAARALIILGPEASPAFPQLARVLAEDQLFSAGTRVIFTLGEIGEPAAPTLARAMTNKPCPMHFVIASQLGRMGPKAAAAIPALISLLGDPEPGLHEQCVESIKAITGGPVSNALPPSTER